LSSLISTIQLVAVLGIAKPSAGPSVVTPAELQQRKRPCPLGDGIAASSIVRIIATLLRSHTGHRVRPPFMISIYLFLHKIDLLP